MKAGDPYIEGQEVIVVANFTQWSDGTRTYDPANPAAVTIHVKKPDGTTITRSTPDVTITNPQLGRFEMALVGDVPGTWRTRSVGDFGGGKVAVDEGSFAVRNSGVV